MKNYGVDNPFNSKIIRDKIEETFINKYGVKRPTQLKEFQEIIQTNSLKFKQYKLPSGKIINVQGFEPFALNELILNHNENDIITDRKDIPRIEYEIDNKKKYYFPDIYLPKENKIIEVKSTWTFEKKKEITFNKATSTKDKGYNFEIWIYKNSKEKEIIIF